jgi:branched-chain amino acid aminotransferase
MSLVWLNGAILAADAARIDPADRGFTLGDGLFETIRAEAGAPLHAPRHFARLRAGAAVLGIPVPYDDSALGAALCALLRENRLAEAALRLTLTRGPATRGVLPQGVASPTLLVTAGMMPAALGPARLIIARGTRRNEASPLSRIKSLNYLDGVLARREAAAAGADDALLLNTRGDLAEATAANVFLRIGGEWVTPRVADGALPGIARGVLLEAGEAREAMITEADCGRAEAGFLVNSLGRREVAEIKGSASF